MTDYSKMSDVEINKLVAIQLGVNPRKTICFISYKESDEIFPDYCNNPADAWPIIEVNGIWMRKICGVWQSTAFKSTDPNDAVKAYHENPLRAAMIVFLMMKDAENEANN